MQLAYNNFSWHNTVLKGAVVFLFFAAEVNAFLHTRLTMKLQQHQSYLNKIMAIRYLKIFIYLYFSQLISLSHPYEVISFRQSLPRLSFQPFYFLFSWLLPVSHQRSINHQLPFSWSLFHALPFSFPHTPSLSYLHISFERRLMKLKLLAMI